MAIFVGNIKKLSGENDNFREVLFTGKKMQLVLMSLQGGEEIGREMHQDADQFFCIREGEGEFIFDNQKSAVVSSGDAVLIPAGTYHNVVNRSKSKAFKFYTLYSPPEYAEGTLYATKEEAEKSTGD